MAVFGQRGVELLKEILNHEPDSLSPYNEELVRLVFSEVEEHDKQAREIVRSSAAQQEATARASAESQDEGAADSFASPADAMAVVIHFESIARNKRHLLSYMLQRMDRLKAVRWKHRQLLPAVSEACSPQEMEFYKSYDKLLTKYTGQAEGIGHDLTLDMFPPKDNMTSVRVMKDAGTHLFSFGELALRRGSLIQLPADEAEPLITSGILKLHERPGFAY